MYMEARNARINCQYSPSRQDRGQDDSNASISPTIPWQNPGEVNDEEPQGGENTHTDTESITSAESVECEIIPPAVGPPLQCFLGHECETIDVSRNEQICNGVASSQNVKSYYAPLKRRNPDDDFDCVVRKLWNAHIGQLPAEIVDGRNWGSSYWQAWYATLDFSKALLDGQPQDICVADDVKPCVATDGVSPD